MADVSVSVVSNGRVLEQITRPLRTLNGRPAVKYKRVLHPVLDGVIYLDETPLTASNAPHPSAAAAAAAAPVSESELTISVIQYGRVKERIVRPLRSFNGKPAVTYKKTLWQIRDECIFLDDIPLAESTAHLEPDLEPERERAGEMAPERSKPSVPPEEIEWDESQRKVIEESRSARLIVDAGPGTGKTAVACARVAALVRKGVEPTNVWLISFTRTAVREVRDRIARHIKDPGTAAAVCIATIDSHAWTLHSGFQKDAKLTGLYEDNIAKATDNVKTDGQVAEFLEGLEHLIVDEAQDVVGPRADFVEALINKIPQSCGVTVFSDGAQAIYDWTEEKTAKVASTPLIERLAARDDFRMLSLDQVHRTDSETLHKIFTDVRKIVLSAADDPAGKKNSVKDAVTRLAQQTGLKAASLKISELPSSALVLFRRRAEALMASSYCGIAPHRLRMSGLPSVLDPWLGACFWDFIDSQATRASFLEKWVSRVTWMPDEEHAAIAWKQLVEIAGKSEQVVDVKLLRRRLSRKQPPASICSPDFGRHGPIVGTIHASKGREADAVFLMLPAGADGEQTDHEAETRVIFVGATRARSLLHVGTGFYPNNGRPPSSGRAWSLNGKDKDLSVMIEVGRDGDIECAGLTGRAHFKTAAEVRRAQDQIARLIDDPVAGATAWCEPIEPYAYKLQHPATGTVLAAFSKQLNNDLWQLAPQAARKIDLNRAKPPERIPHLRLLGARTLVLASDAPELSSLHEPWASSGFMLAPMVLGYTKIWFRRYGRQ